MTPEPTDSSDLWSFMLRFYAVPDVAPACLRLQETFNLDIPLFLALLHAAVSGSVLEKETVAQIDQDCAQWRETVIRPLRQIRTAMKVDPWMVQHTRVPELREEIKALELRAERFEIEMLAQWLSTLPRGAPCHDPAKLCEMPGLKLKAQSHPESKIDPTDSLLLATTLVDFLEL